MNRRSGLGRRRKRARKSALAVCRAHGTLVPWDCYCTWGKCGCCHFTHECTTCHNLHTLTREEAQEVKPIAPKSAVAVCLHDPDYELETGQLVENGVVWRAQEVKP